MKTLFLSREDVEFKVGCVWESCVWEICVPLAVNAALKSSFDLRTFETSLLDVLSLDLFDYFATNSMATVSFFFSRTIGNELILTKAGYCLVYIYGVSSFTG